MKRNIHFGVRCSKCQAQNIEGFRYHCLLCFEFNLCEGCQSETEHKHGLLTIKQAPDKVVKVKELQQLRENIRAMLLGKKYVPTQEERQQRQRQLDDWRQKVEVYKDQVHRLIIENMAKEEQQRELKYKLENQDRQFPHESPSVPREMSNSTGQTAIQFFRIPKRYQQPLRNQQYQRNQSNWHKNLRINEQPQRNQPEEEMILQKAHTISQRIRIDFYESLRYVKEHPYMKIDELINMILR